MGSTNLQCALQFIALVAIAMLMPACQGHGPIPSTEYLPAPEIVSASQGTFADEIQLTWSKVPGATNYRIWNNLIGETLAELGDVDTWTDRDLGNFAERKYFISSSNKHQNGRSVQVYGYRRIPAGPAVGFGGAGSWRSNGGRPGGGGYTEVNGPNGASLLWQRQPGGRGRINIAPLVADDGTIFMVVDEELVAISSTYGSVIWKVGINITNLWLTKDGMLIGSYSSRLFAMEPDGSLLWVLDYNKVRKDYQVLADQFSTTAFGDTGQIFVFLDDKLFGVSMDGVVLWDVDLPVRATRNHVVREDGSIIYADGENTLTARAADGELLWQIPQGDPSNGWENLMLTKSEDLVCEDTWGISVVSSDGQSVRRLNTESLYTNLLGIDGARTAYISNNISEGSGSSVIKAINLDDLQVLWEISGDWSPAQAISCDSGLLYIGFPDKVLALYKTGHVAWEHTTFYDGDRVHWLAMGPDETLFHISSDGSIAAFRDNTGIPPAPQNVYASQGLYNSAISLHWDQSPGAIYYKIARVGSTDPEARVDQTTRWFDEEPGSGTHEYTVRAGNENGLSEPSLVAVGNVAGENSTEVTWGQTGHDAAHSNHSDQTGPLTINELWQSSGPDGSSSAQLLVGKNGMVYVAQNGIRAYSPQGKLEWIYDENHWVYSVMNDPTGNLLFQANEGENFALTPYGAEIAWDIPATGNLIAIGHDEAKYIYLKPLDWGGDGVLTVLEPDDSVRYTAQLKDLSFPGVSAEGILVYRESVDDEYGYEYGNSQNIMVAIGRDGNELWRYDPWDIVDDEDGNIISVEFFGSPLINTDGSISTEVRVSHWGSFPSSGGTSRVVSLTPPMPNDSSFIATINPDGTLRWKREHLNGIFAQAPNAGLYVADKYYFGGVRLLDSDGDDVWVAKIPDEMDYERPDSIISDAAGNVYVKYGGYSDGSIIALSDSGEIVWSINDSEWAFERCNLALGEDGVLFYLKNNGPLVAIGED